MRICKFLLEFKYAPVKSDRKASLLKLKTPLADDVAQINRYAEDIHREFPQFNLRKYVVYIVGRKGFVMFRVN